MGSDYYLNPPRSNNAGLKAKAKIEALKKLAKEIDKIADEAMPNVVLENDVVDVASAVAEVSLCSKILRIIDQEVAELSKIKDSYS